MVLMPTSYITSRNLVFLADSGFSSSHSEPGTPQPRPLAQNAQRWLSVHPMAARITSCRRVSLILRDTSTRRSARGATSDNVSWSRATGMMQQSSPFCDPDFQCHCNRSGSRGTGKSRRRASTSATHACGSAAFNFTVPMKVYEGLPCRHRTRTPQRAATFCPVRCRATRVRRHCWSGKGGRHQGMR